MIGALALCIVFPICSFLLGSLLSWIVTASGLFHLGEYGAWMGIMFGLYAAYADIVVGPVFWWTLCAKRLSLPLRTKRIGTIAVAAPFCFALIWVLWGEQTVSHPIHLEDVSDDGRYVLAKEDAPGSSTLYRIDTATGVASRFRAATGHGSDSFANFSPDASEIVYAHSDDEKNYTIMLADVSGTNPHPLLTDHGNDSWPRFSYDGRTIYFIRTQGNGFDLFSSTLDGKDVRQLTHEHYTFELGPYLQATPVVSSDGKEMLFVTLEDRLQLCFLSGPNQKPSDLLFSLPGAPSSRNYVSAYFSADDEAILFMAASEGKHGFSYEIYRLDLKSRRVQQLTQNSAYSSDFRLSVRGKKAVFLKWKLSRFQKLPRSFQLELMDMQSGKIIPIDVTGIAK
jgi:Tol biopolymer transport system component